MIWFMTTVHVRANQTTVDWAEGAEFVCERTPFVDNLIKHGGLTDLGAIPDEYTDTSHLGSVDVRQAEARLTAAYSNIDSSTEDRRSAELALDEAQKKSAAAQENLTEARTDADATLAELDTDPGTEPQKAPRTRRKSS